MKFSAGLPCGHFCHANNIRDARALCYSRRVKDLSIAIVGPGRLGSALARKLHSAGSRISEIIGRDRQSLSRARAVARSVDGIATTVQTALLDADVIWFCVPDSQIEAVATTLSSHSWRGKIALHSSGVLTSDALKVLRKAGASIASAHPLMTFIRGSLLDLRGVPFALEGDARALRATSKVVHSLGGQVAAIGKRDKPAYHLFATKEGQLQVSLLAASEGAARLAGLSANEARRRMMPIVRQTIWNYETHGAAAAFSGPFVRGDVETVRSHLKALSKSPALKHVYASLAEAAFRNLPHRNANKIRAALLEHDGMVLRD